MFQVSLCPPLDPAASKPTSLPVEPRERQAVARRQTPDGSEASAPSHAARRPRVRKTKGACSMALFPDAFNTLLGLQQALESFRTSGWLQSSPSGSGSYPPVNIFRKGEDFVLIAEVPGIGKSDLDIQVKGRT